MKFRLLLLFVFLQFSLAQAAVMDSIRVEQHKGKNYIIHRVEPKETLYAIGRKYKISTDEIANVNEDLENGLQMYQEIRIPMAQKTKQAPIVYDEPLSTKYHVVRAGETLFALSRKYGLRVDSLASLNDLKAFNLSVGDTIFVEPKEVKKEAEMEVEDPIEAVEGEAPKETLAGDQIHVVIASETMYSISKQYDVKVRELKEWNGLKSNALSLGQRLIVGKAAKTPVDKPAVIYDEFLLPEPEEDSVEIDVVDAPKEAITSDQIHVVIASETMYSIARQYDVKVRELKEWNGLKSNALSLGQRLIVGKTTKAPVKKPVVVYDEFLLPEPEEDTVVIVEVPKKQPLDTLYVKTDNSQFKTKETLNDNETLVEEEGFAMKIEDTDYTKKFLALHRSAPLGSVLEVTNEMTNLSISVRVVGRLLENGLNEKLLLRLSSAAFKELGALDSRIPIQVSYAK